MLWRALILVICFGVAANAAIFAMAFDREIVACARRVWNVLRGV